MNVLETCAVAVAISSGVIAVACVVALVSLRRIRRRVEALSLNTNRTLARLNGVAANLDGIVRDARRLETRVHHVAEVLLDEIEPPLRVVSAVLAGARTGFASWMGSAADGVRGDDGSRAGTVPQKGDTHAQDT